MARIIAVTNQKGGVGKTTTVVNTAAGLAELGKNVLVVDFDPQANAVSGFGVECGQEDPSVYDLLIDDSMLAADVIKRTEIQNCEIIPSHIDLSGAHVELSERKDRYFILRNKLEAVRGSYDYIFIDTPPSLGYLTLGSLASVEEVLIPLQAEYYALEGLSQLLKTISIVQKKLNPALCIMGIVVTMFDARTNLSTQVLEEVNNAFAGKVFKTIIPRNIKLSEAPSFGKPVLTYQTTSMGALSYRELAKEIDNNG